MSEVTRAFPLLAEGVGVAALGQKKRQFKMLVVAGYDHPVRVWLDGPQVLMLDVQYPTFPSEISVLLNELGEPEAKLDYPWGSIHIERGEWVYPERGLALLLAPKNVSVFHLAVFPRTTVQGYEENFRLHLGKKPFPRSK